MAQWYAAIGEQRIGPMELEQLRGWIAQGQVGPGMLVWTEGMEQWAPARDVRELWTGQTNPPPILEPHRGIIVLVVGALGLWLGPLGLIPAIVAFQMASTDLAKMLSGRMDSSGRGLTQAGRVLGIIAICLSALWFLILLFVLAAH